MKIIFVRHGQDDETRRGGWSQYGLLEAGHAQAKMTADYFRKQTAYDIGALYASDLRRTMETAAYFSESLGLPIRQDSALREINNGDLAGMPNEEAAVKYPGLFFSTLEMEKPYPNGESPAEFFRRVQTWFTDFVKENRSSPRDILVVTHGGVIKVIYHLVRKTEWSNQHNTIPAEKCSIHVLNVDTMAWEVENQVLWQSV